MDTPQPPAGPALPVLDDAHGVLLRVARLLYSAAGAAELITVSRALDLSLDDRLAEFDVKVLLWQVVALLPPGLRLDQREQHDHDGVPLDDLRSTLRAAAQELRQASLTDLPACTPTLLTDLTALIAHLDTSPRRRGDGPELS